MAFYIKPPRGHIDISTLEDWAMKRTMFLLNIYSCRGNLFAVKELIESEETAKCSDCLIEGTTKDAVSHFILRFGRKACERTFGHNPRIEICQPHAFEHTSTVKVWLGFRDSFHDMVMQINGLTTDYFFQTSVHYHYGQTVRIGRIGLWSEVVLHQFIIFMIS